MINPCKPRPFHRRVFRRLLPKKAMTIAIGTHFPDGVIVCADTKFVDDNGKISYGKKVYAASVNAKSFVVAHASDDANAATMLSQDILAALCRSTEQSKFELIIKKCMSRWQRDYGQSAVPLIQFVIGCSSEQATSIYFCQPPNVVIAKPYTESVTVGSAVNIIEAVLPIILSRPTEDVDSPEYNGATPTLLGRMLKRDCANPN